MTKSVKLWNREFNLEVKFEDLNEEGILEIQEEGAKQFLLSDGEQEKSEKLLKQYIKENNNEKLEEENIENIFKYVMPEYLYILRDEERQQVAVMCDYKFDPENGIAVVFEKEKIKEIGIQDIVL